MRATKMTKNKENQLQRGARDQEKEDRRVLVPKVLVGTVEGLIFSVIVLTSMMKGKRRLGQHLELRDRGDQDHFPNQQCKNGTRGSQSPLSLLPPLTLTQSDKGKGKSGKGGKGKGGKGKRFGSEIGVLDSHFGWQGTPLGHIYPDGSPYLNLVPICSLSTSLPVESRWEGQGIAPQGAACRDFYGIGTKSLETRPISTSNQFHVLSAHDDDAYFPELGSDTCSDRPRMPPIAEAVAPTSQEEEILVSIGKRIHSRRRTSSTRRTTCGHSAGQKFWRRKLQETPIR